MWKTAVCQFCSAAALRSPRGVLCAGSENRRSGGLKGVENGRRRLNLREAAEDAMKREREFASEEYSPPPGSKSFREFVDAKLDKRKKVAWFRSAWKEYFKEGVNKEDNLLPWEAIDQIRALHRSEPSVWTPENISSSFPVSTVEAEKLIKTSPRPGNPNRIQRHDDAVRRRWEALMRGDPEGVVSEYTKKLIASGQIKYLPMFPVKRKILPLESTKSTEERGKPPGIFEKIIKHHYAAIKEQQEGKDN